MDIGSSYHIGHLVFDHFKRYPDVIHQVDAATGEEETYSSVLSRSIRLARSLREFGLKAGDILAIGGRNHLDIHIPFYAGLFNGLPFYGVDPYYKYDEVRTLLNKTKPAIAFCQIDSVDIYAKVIVDLGLETKLITYEDGILSLADFIQKYDNGQPEEDFKVAEFDIDKIYAFMISTSGTTGNVKLAAFRHKPFMMKTLGFLKFHTQEKLKGSKTLNLSPVHWISSFFSTIFTPLVGDTIIQTSKLDDSDHVIEIINKYKPETTLFSPTLLSFLVSRKDDVDLTCFRSISLTGSKIYPDVLAKFKELLSKDATTSEAYGQTEMIGPVLLPNPKGPTGNCGRPLPGYSIKLIDVNSGKEITGPNVAGEFWTKGLGFTEYYNDPDETALAFTEDGYFKTGDLLYRDENHNYYFVDRIKTLIKYRNSHVMPTEIEEVIRKHPGVAGVCVVGVPHAAHGQLPAAAVLPAPGAALTAHEICQLVANKLSKNKELRGGVVFLDSLPYTSTGKIARAKIAKLVASYNRT